MINLIIAKSTYLVLEAGSATCVHTGSLCVIECRVQ